MLGLGHRPALMAAQRWEVAAAVALRVGDQRWETSRGGRPARMYDGNLGLTSAHLGPQIGLTSAHLAPQIGPILVRCPHARGQRRGMMSEGGRMNSNLSEAGGTGMRAHVHPLPSRHHHKQLLPEDHHHQSPWAAQVVRVLEGMR